MDSDKDLKRIIRFFRGREEVSSLFLFGSCGTGRCMEESDIDLAVLVDESRMEGKDFGALRDAYYAASPDFSMRTVDIVILNTAPPFLRHRILRTARNLFDRNRRLRTRFTARALIEYLDFQYNEEICLKAVARRAKEAGRG